MRTRLLTSLVALALCAAAAQGAFGQGKKHKFKEKRFETVVKQDPRDYEGTYIGMESDYVIEVRVAAGGGLEVKYMEDGQSAAVTNVRLAGAHLTADLAYPGGRMGRLDATFSNRILNGETSFGMLVDGLNIHLEGNVALSSYFYRRK